MVTLVIFDHWMGRPDVWSWPGVIIGLVTTAACVISAGELVDMWRRGGSNNLPMVATMIGTALMALSSCMPMFFPREPGTCPLGMFGGAVAGFAGALVLIALFVLATNSASSKDRTDGIARAILAVAYLFPLIAFLPPHRLLHGHNGSGLCALLLILTTVKMSDACAYFFGKLLGRTRLAPRLSPNKTVEGGFGGLIGAVIGALIVFWAIAPWVAGPQFSQSPVWIVGYALVVAVAGLIGDLFESLLKRDAACKDSSAWLPGLGGVLDVVDSIIFAAPASWLYWVATGAI